MIFLFLNADEYLTSRRVAELKAALGDPELAGLNPEAIEGLTENQEIVSGGFKAISRELEDGKRISKQLPGAKKDEKDKK